MSRGSATLLYYYQDIFSTLQEVTIPSQIHVKFVMIQEKKIEFFLIFAAFMIMISLQKHI